ncbi:MAG: glycoside hydrolase family 99-like domain-containing protein [Syntrophaceae bacterium]|nr:glycoside hydrolase family 99-like domain-containing protein [Syntrophaceae bacterium]
MSNNRQKIINRKLSYWQIIVGYIKQHLIKYPLLYELTIKLYRYVRNLIPDFASITYKDGSSWKYISYDLGLLQVNREQSEKISHPLRSFTAHYEKDEDFSKYITDIKAIAYYLPQFHAIPENDEWWGKGFTDWTNTKKTEPLFPGHYQPREPHEDIGYYDLSDVEIIKKQVAMAKKHGIFGFCFHHYWFHGKRLLGKPVDLFLKHPEINMPFCLCWANETWSKRWDGSDHLILMKQIFSPEDDLQFIQFLEPYLRDSRYIRVNGKPMLIVYRISKLPNPLETAKRWRNWAKENGIGELHLVAVTHGEVFPHTSLSEIGFDAYAAFPPHTFKCKKIHGHRKIFTGGYRFDYESGVNSYTYPNTDTSIYEGCTLGWDNTPRFLRNATIYLNFSLNSYYKWLRKIIENTSAKYQNPENRFIFINAWNEWAEGAYLEPDKKYGYAYINTTSRALFNIPTKYLEKQEESHESAIRYTKEYESTKYLIDKKREKAWAFINQLIRSDSHILEFGPSSGFFTRYLKEERNAVVDIVEIDESCAEQASEFARDCHIGDIEQYLWKDAFAGRQYDFVLFADVLEHLRDPWSVLKEAGQFLKADGRIIISLPNIAHVQIIASLYNNDFSYSSAGILDKSHLRFFTEPTIRQMVEEAGLQVCNLIPVQSPLLPEGCGTYWNKSGIPFKLKRMLSKKEHAYAMQFVVCCKRK